MMRSPFLLRSVVFGFGGLLWGLPTLGQTPNNPNPTQKPRPIFPQLFPHPTGTNGYEDLVLACDALQESDIYPKLDQNWSNTTLEEMRSAFADPPVQKALLLLKNGLNKPIASPQKMEEVEPLTLFPQYAFFRKLARLLSLKIFADATDGKSYEVIEATEMSLQIGYNVGQDTLISGLVGIAIDVIAINRMAQFVAQLSLKECDRLSSLLDSRLKAPLTAVKLFTNERDFTLRMLDKDRLKVDEILPLPTKDREPLTEEENALRAKLTGDPAELKRLLEASRDYVKTIYNTAIENASLSAWKRKPEMPHVVKESSVTMLGELISPSYDQALMRYDQNQARLQLLALHVAIRRFRWKHDRLPATLKELKHPELLTDPFTGEPLIYSILPQGETYDLHSVGAIINDEAGKPTRVRNPLYLPSRL